MKTLVARGAARRTHRNRRRPLHLGRARGEHMALGGHSRSSPAGSSPLGGTCSWFPRRAARSWRLCLRLPGKGGPSGDRGPRPHPAAAARAAEHSARGGRASLGVRPRSRAGGAAPRARAGLRRGRGAPPPGAERERQDLVLAGAFAALASILGGPIVAAFMLFELVAASGAVPAQRSDTCCSPASSPPAPATSSSSASATGAASTCRSLRAGAARLHERSARGRGWCIRSPLGSP